MMPTSSLALVARSLTKAYGRSRGIADVDLTVAEGDVMGLVGANGAGKTTLMRVLLDFVRPTSGSISAFGYDSVRDSVDVRRVTAYLPGELVVPPQLTGAQAMERYTLARPDLDRTQFSRLADRLDLDLSRRFADLSKGNKQKVGLVLAFAARARLLVLDEPTSGLDPLLQHVFGTLLSEAVADGATVLLSSHVMSEVEAVASKVALLREGRVAVVDDVRAILAQGRRRGRARPRDVRDLQALQSALAASSGVREVTRDGDEIAFACSGDMDALLKAVAGFSVRSLDVAHGDLEDAFFSAYEGPAQPAGGS
jgi:ABC-2 type transport system ATP-binding protein